MPFSHKTFTAGKNNHESGVAMTQTSPLIWDQLLTDHGGQLWTSKKKKSDYILFIFEPTMVCIATKFKLFYSRAGGVSLFNRTCMLEHMFQNSCLAEKGWKWHFYRWILFWLAFSFPLSLFLWRADAHLFTFLLSLCIVLHVPHSLFSFISECINPDERCVGENFPLCSDPLICCTWLP